MTDDELDALLRRAMDVAPSAALAVRIRAQLEREPEPSTSWSRGVAVAVTLAAAASLAWFVLPGPIRAPLRSEPKPFMAPVAETPSSEVNHPTSPPPAGAPAISRHVRAHAMRTSPFVGGDAAVLVPVGEPLPVARAAVEPQRLPAVEVPRLSIDGIALVPLDVAPLEIAPMGERPLAFQGGLP
jgi:hypothetical protein